MFSKPIKKALHFQNFPRAAIFKPGLLFNFSAEKLPSQESLKPEFPRELIEKSYDPKRIIKVNDPNFIAEVLRQEEAERKADRYRFTMKRFKYPLLLIFLMGFFFHLWFTVPYKVLYKHLTLTDQNSLSLGYCYSWVFAPLSVRNTQDFVVYFSVMSHGLIVVNRWLKPRQIMGFYLVNGLLCCAATLGYEKFIKRDEKIRGKCLGGCSALGFMGVLLGMKPEHKLFKQLFLPYQALVIGLLIYESQRRRNERELCKYAHLLAFANGLLFGRLNRTLVF